MENSKRTPVTLRFGSKDIKLMKQVVNKEFGPGVKFEHGLRQIVLNTFQAYINQLAKAVESSKEVPSDGEANTNGDSSQVSV
jgi:hypothetical protein